jgi:hypothetical protein
LMRLLGGAESDVDDVEEDDDAADPKNYVIDGNDPSPVDGRDELPARKAAVAKLLLSDGWTGKSNIPTNGNSDKDTQRRPLITEL